MKKHVRKTLLFVMLVVLSVLVSGCGDKPLAYNLNQVKEENGVKFVFKHLFLDEDYAVAVLEVQNNRVNPVKYEGYDAKLSINGSWLESSSILSDTYEEISPKQKATLHVYFRMPDYVDWKNAKDILFQDTQIYDSFSKGIFKDMVIEDTTFKVKNLPSYKDNSLELDD